MGVIIRKINIVEINRRKVVYGYELEMELLSNEVKDILESFKVGKNIYHITADYLIWLYLCGELSKESTRKLKVKNFVYSKELVYPMLTIDGSPVLEYSDIPADIIRQDLIGMTTRNEWSQYFYNTALNISNTYSEFCNSTDLGFYDTQIGLYSYKYGNENKEENKITGFNASTTSTDKSAKEYKEKNESNNDNLDLNLIEIEEVRPFEYNRNNDRLLIPIKSNPPNFNLTLKLMRDLISKTGVSMDLEGIRNYNRELRNEVISYENKFKEKFNLKYMPSTSTRYFEETHPHYLILKGIGEFPGQFPYKKNNSISFTKPVRKHLLEKIKDNPEKYTEGAEEILSGYNTYLDIVNGPLKIGTPILNAANGKKSDVDYEIDEETNKLIFYCNLNLVKTKRITTSNPNFQGMPKEIKSFITGSKPGRKIMSIDIKAQEVMILIFGILENKKLKDLVLINKDPYKSFSICAGLCDENTFTQEIKDMVKVPVLSIMNGKSSSNIISEMKNIKRSSESKISGEHVANTILGLITKDPGYLKIVKVAREEQKKCKSLREYNVIRRGLFGTKAQSTDPTDKKGSPFTQSLNANFQLTAAEILSYGLTCMILDLKDRSNIHGLSLNQMTPSIPIYDEMVIDYDEKFEKEVIELVKFYLCPEIEGWLELSGDITVGDNYVYHD